MGALTTDSQRQRHAPLAVNAAFAGWTAETLPADWPDYRWQWELGRAIAFVLAPTAFCTLLRTAFAAASARRREIERRPASVDVA